MSLSPLIASTATLASGSLAAEPVLAANADADGIDGADGARYRAKTQAAAEKFEAFFIADMLKQMRRATRELADDDSASKNPINEDMLDVADGKLAEVLAGQHAFGVADAILRQLLPAPPGAGAAPAAGMPLAPFKPARPPVAL